MSRLRLENDKLKKDNDRLKLENDKLKSGAGTDLEVPPDLEAGQQIKEERRSKKQKEPEQPGTKYFNS